MEQGNDEDGDNCYVSSKGLASSSSSRKLMKRETEDGQLSWDILDTMFDKLDLDEIFQFGRVCKSWREFQKTYWKNFMASPAPFMIQASPDKNAYTFISLSEQKVYRMEMDYFWGLSYSGCSSGYLIMAGDNNTLLLMNPFTRKKRGIITSAIQGKYDHKTMHPLLAFAKGSEEFIIVVLCKPFSSLHIYQSRHFGWSTYSDTGDPLIGIVANVVVFQHTLYVVTNKARIGVLNMNPIRLEFLKLSNSPNLASSLLKLVSIDGKLLVVHCDNRDKLEVYKIDFSSMAWVRLETLGDLALFYARDKNCHALRNPGRWGYDADSVYFIDGRSTEGKVYSMKTKQEKPLIPNGHRALLKSRSYPLDWYFRQVQDEIDHSFD